MKGKSSLVHKRLSLFAGKILLELRVYSVGAGESREICAAANITVSVAEPTVLPAETLLRTKMRY
ncbi:MAG: hypothetical protein KKH28_13865 [Elusimicrobia bacterium]|nr:hypothetical protein [Elusimicrobiota bacterium]